MTSQSDLLAVPNVSEGRDAEMIESLGIGFTSGADLLDTHSDVAHNRTVFTLSGPSGSLVNALVEGARASVAAINITRHHGLHPCIGALDVCPIVWLDEEDRDTAELQAREVGEAIAGELSVPVFLYGALASTEERRERAFFREGGIAELRRRMAAGELVPDHGPAEPHPSAGGTLVTARPPLVAFNLELDTADAGVAREVAAALREAGGGLPGVRAIGLPSDGQRSQISTNVHDPGAVPLARVVEEVRRLSAAHGARPVSAEIVGLAPEVALAGFPEDLPIEGFDPDAQVIERRLQSR